MRQIKFRAINSKDEMIFGLPYTDGANETTYYKEFNNRMCWRNEEGAHCNQPYKNGTLMQYTGLEDCHGAEIYEGDILDLHSTVNGVNLFEVYYNKTQARFSIKYYTDRMPSRSLEYEYSVSGFFKPCEFSGEVDYEVVGNIYENPELISGACEVE